MTFAFMAQAAGIPAGSVSVALQGLKDKRRIQRKVTLTGVSYRALNAEVTA